MAEAGLVFSILGLAAEGLKISETVSAFLDRVRSASKDIQAIITDVQSTSETLKQLADCLGKHGNSNLANDEWKSSTEAHLSTCSKIFSEIRATISDSKRSQLDFDTKFGRLKRFKVAFKHEKVVSWKVKLDSLKTDFSFKINVLNLARHEKERQTASTRLRKKAELDRLEYEKESLGLEIAYKKMKFAQRRAAEFHATPSSSDSDVSSNSDEEDVKRSREDAGKKAVRQNTTASQPVPEQKHESHPSVAEHGLVTRRRRHQTQTRGSRRISSLRLDLLSSLEDLLPRHLAGNVDQDSLRTLVQVLQDGKVKMKSLNPGPISSTTLTKESTASDPRPEAKSEVVEPRDENGGREESEWESENEESSANPKLNYNAQVPELGKRSSSNGDHHGQSLPSVKTKGSASSHGNTTLDGSPEMVAPDPINKSLETKYVRSGRAGLPNEPKETVITSAPGSSPNQATTGANAPLTTVPETFPVDRIESGVHIEEADDASDGRIRQPGAGKSTGGQESPAKSTKKIPSVGISQQENAMKPSEVKIAYAEKDHGDRNTVNSEEIEYSPSLEAWSLRDSNLKTKLGFRTPFRGTSLWTRLHLHENDLADATENSGTADSLWSDLALLSNYQKKQIDRLVSMRRQQDNQVELISVRRNQDQRVESKTQWFLHALNSHPHNVSNGCIVNLVVVIGRCLVGPRELGFDLYGQEPLPQDIATLSPQVGKSIVRDPSEVHRSHAHGQDSKRLRDSKAIVDPDPFGASKLFAPTGKPLDISGQGVLAFDEFPAATTLVPLPPQIPEEKHEVLGVRDFENRLPTRKKAKTRRDRSRSQYRAARSRSHSKERRRDRDLRLVDSWAEASVDSWAARPISSNARAIGNSYSRERINKPSVTETADNNHINQMLQKWTNVEQATQNTQSQQRRRRRSEKGKKIKERGYGSPSDTEDERIFIGGEQVTIQPGNSGNRNGTAKLLYPDVLADEGNERTLFGASK